MNTNKYWRMNNYKWNHTNKRLIYLYSKNIWILMGYYYQIYIEISVSVSYSS